MNDVMLANPGGIFEATDTGGSVVRVNPREEVVVAGPWAGKGTPIKGGFLLSSAIDEVVRQFGLRVYELMEYDPAVWCATELWKSGVLSDGMRLAPGVRRVPGEIVSEKSRRADLDMATTIHEAAERSFAGLDVPIDETLEEYLDAYKFGCEMGEVTYRWGDDEDKDRLMFDSVVIKPRWSWGFRVDRYMDVMSIRGWTGDQWLDIETEKFSWLSWKPRKRDPRGRSGYRAAYTPWNAKNQIFPDFAEFLHHFADPFIAVTAGEKARDDYTNDPATGRRMPWTVMQQILDAIQGFKRRSGMALPPGSTVQQVGGNSDGGVYHGAFDRYDMEIFRAILFSGRPVMSAAHNSKGDSETSLDLVAMSFRQGRVTLKRMLEKQLLYNWVVANWGKAAAARFTPTVSFGANNETETELINALATAYQKGFMDESQLPFLYEKLGWPEVPPEVLKLKAERRAQGIADAARAKSNPDDDQPQEDDGNEPKPKKKPGRKAA